jgi:hypothetical protein
MAKKDFFSHFITFEHVLNCRSSHSMEVGMVISVGKYMSNYQLYWQRKNVAKIWRLGESKMGWIFF